MSGETPQATTPHAARMLFMASAVIGIASGVLLVAVLQRLERLPPFMPMPPVGRWHIYRYELPVALLGAMGVYLFCPRCGRINALVGAVAGLAAMLLADTFRTMHYLSAWEWAQAREGVYNMFAWGGWPKVLCYVFGVYVASDLCSGRFASAEVRKDA